MAESVPFSPTLSPREPQSSARLVAICQRPRGSLSLSSLRGRLKRRERVARSTSVEIVWFKVSSLVVGCRLVAVI